MSTTPNPSNWFNTLHEQANAQQLRPHVLTIETGGATARALITEHGARWLACELPGAGELGNPIFATDCTPDRTLTGGDRLWIAPETAWFWPSLDDARRDPKGTARTPHGIDPADYHPDTNAFVDDSASLALTSPIALHDRRNDKTGQGNAKRSFMLKPVAGDQLPGGVTGVGLSITNTLTIDYEQSDQGLVAGSWDILQLPPTGVLICPTRQQAEPTSYYEPFGDRHVTIGPDATCFHIDSRRRIKMGLAAATTAGVMGYLRAVGEGQSQLIVRRFPVHNPGAYCDVPRDDQAHDAAVAGLWHDRALQGDVLQAYNDDGDAFPGSAGFGEMEYHDQAIIVGRSPSTRTGTSETLIAAGPTPAIEQLACSQLDLATLPDLPA